MSPIRECSSNGKAGVSYGNQKCYVGKNARSKAIKQMKAIKASEAKKKK